jgi:hypothetical protein
MICLDLLLGRDPYNAQCVIKCKMYCVDDNCFRCYALNSISVRRVNPYTLNQNQTGGKCPKESRIDDSEGNTMIESLFWLFQ